MLTDSDLQIINSHNSFLLKSTCEAGKKAQQG